MVKGGDTRPRHQQIAADLRAKIMSGDLAPDDKLPSTAQLVEKYSAANATIQRALAILKDEDFVRSEVGKAVFVRHKQPFIVAASAYISPATTSFSYQMLPPVREVRPPNDVPKDVAVALGLGEDGRAILRRRVLLHDGKPVELSYSYYPSDIAADTALARNSRIKGGAPRVLAERGYPEREFVDTLSVRAPTTEEVETLDLPADVPVIRQFRVIYSGERAVEVSTLIKGGHLYELQYQQIIARD